MTIDTVIAALESADLDGLREEWRRRYGAPPRLRSKTLLRNVLAWRIQADVYGGLDEQTRRLLRDERPPREPSRDFGPSASTSLFFRPEQGAWLEQ